MNEKSFSIWHYWLGKKALQIMPILFLGIYITIHPLNAQSESPPDSLGFTTYHDWLMLSPYLRYQWMQAELESNGESLLHVRNHGLGIGGRVFYGGIGMGGTLPLRIVYPDQPERSRGYGIAGLWGLKKITFHIDGNLRQGYNLTNHPDLAFRNDIYQIALNAGGIYKWNYNQYAFRMPSRLSLWQNRSAGSFMASISFHYQAFGSESLIQLYASDPGIPDFTFYQNIGAKLGLGYGYTLIRGNWYFSAIGIARMRLIQSSFRGPDIPGASINTGFSPWIQGALGYHKDRWFLSLNGQYEADFVQNTILNAQGSRYMVYAMVGIRMEPPKILVNLRRFVVDRLANF